MTRNEYVNRVLSVMRHVTAKEREAIRAEIDAHIEDHICDLLELDYPEDLAEERTMALMGDPEEVGRALDQHYKPTLWDTLEGIATILMIVVGLQAFLALGLLFHARDYLEACIAPEVDSVSDYWAELREETDYRVTVGNDILKVYHVSVGEKRMSNAEDTGVEQRLVAEISVCAYDRIPFGIVSDELLTYLKAEDQRGTAVDRWGGGSGSWGAEYRRIYVPIQPSDTYVTLSYDRYGEHITLQVPLPEVTP